MMRMFVFSSLFLALLVGCSSNRKAKSAEQEPPKGNMETVSAAAPIPAPPAATPAPAAKPTATPVAHADSKSEKAPSGAAAESSIEQLAKCLTKKGAVMYGVFWCSHCQDQKKEFGDAFKYVHYVECVKPDAPRVLIPECKAQGITHTPTWIFGDGSRMEGALPLATLAEKAGCKAP